MTLRDVVSSIGKASASSSNQADDPEIADRVQREFGLGINIYQLQIDTLVGVTLAIAGERSRFQLLTLVGQELNDRVTQPAHKLAWQGLLQNL